MENHPKQIDLDSDEELEYLDVPVENDGDDNQIHKTIQLLTQRICELELEIEQLKYPNNKQRSRRTKQMHKKISTRQNKKIAKNNNKIAQFIDYCTPNDMKPIRDHLPILFDKLANGRDSFDYEDMERVCDDFHGDLENIFQIMVGGNVRVSWKRFLDFFMPYLL